MLKALAALLLLTACTNPQFGAAVNFGSGGVSVAPSASGMIGGAHVTVSG